MVVLGGVMFLMSEVPLYIPTAGPARAMHFAGPVALQLGLVYPPQPQFSNPTSHAQTFDPSPDPEGGWNLAGQVALQPGEWRALEEEEVHPSPPVSACRGTSPIRKRSPPYDPLRP
jgi:hypothetical protein